MFQGPSKFRSNGSSAEVLGSTRARFGFDRQKGPKTRDDGVLYVKTKFFEARPNPEANGRLELSTFWLDGATDAEIWDLGYEHSVPRERTLKCRADVDSDVFTGLGLVYLDQVPPPRHGSFVDWPESASLRDAITAKLCSVATVRLPPDPARKGSA